MPDSQMVMVMLKGLRKKKLKNIMVFFLLQEVGKSYIGVNMRLIRRAIVFLLRLKTKGLMKRFKQKFSLWCQVHVKKV